MSATTPRSPDRDTLRPGLALAQSRGVGCVSFRAFVERWGSAAEAFERAPGLRDRAEALAAADAVLAAMDRAGAFVRILGDAGYPEALLDLSDAPSCLFGLGRSALLEQPIVAIVGTRNCSASGERIARHFAASLSRAGTSVASGMARGIDAAAHGGALEARGGTIAVLGGGADQPYPPRHRALHAAIVARGLVLSETPPGTLPPPGAFPRRNRIIAALARAVVVIEAGVQSGALLTAGKAVELGRAVGAVPGPIDDPRCTGSNRLLQDGAVMLTSSGDVLMLGGVAAPEGAADRPITAPGESRDGGERVSDVLDALAHGAADAMEVARLSGLPTRELLAALAALEANGAIWTDHRGVIHVAP